MKICTIKQAKAAVRLCRDELDIGSPISKRNAKFITLKWYIPLADRDTRIDEALLKAGIPYRRKINKKWPRKTPQQVRCSFNKFEFVPTGRMASSLLLHVPLKFRIDNVKLSRRLKKKLPSPKKVRCPCCRSWISPRRKLDFDYL